jgi:hypothetical protein
MSWGVATQNGVSVSLASIVSLSCGATEFIPSELFTGGAQGAWYDPSDFTTLFQDSAGTTPVTAVEQSVRLMRDKSGNSNHATAPSDASRPVLRARYNNFVGTATLATQSVTTLATTYKLSFSGAGTITLTGTNIGVYSAGTTTITCTAGTLTATVLGTVTDADLRLSSTSASMPSYQLVTTSTNYDTVGFLPYLSFITDDSFSTSSINFSATDKMFTCGGFTFLADTSQVVHELSASSDTNNGAFYLTHVGTSAIRHQLRGTAAALYGDGANATPATYVYSQIFDQAVPNISKIQARKNGTAQSLTLFGSTVGSNFGNYPFYIGRRNNLSFPFNGRFYQLIVCGKAVSASELASTETYVNNKTGAF